MTRSRQQDLPGIDKKIPELHQKALEYATARDERMDLTKQEVGLKTELAGLMSKHKVKNYNVEGVEIELVEPETEPTVKVKVHRADDAEEEIL